MLDDLDERQLRRLRAKLVQGCQPKDVAREYGYCVSNIYRYMAAEGIPRRDKRLWTEREDDLIRRHYPAHGASWDGWARLMPERKPTRRVLTWRARKLGVRYEGRSYGGEKGAT